MAGTFGLMPDYPVYDPADITKAPWDVDAVPAILRGLELRDSIGHTRSHIKGPIEKFGETMNAFASIVVPADPAVVGDDAAGDLVVLKKVRGQKDVVDDSFFNQMIRFIRLDFTPELGFTSTEEDGLSVFFELDSLALSKHGKSKFSDLTTSQQEAIVTGLLTLPPSPTEEEELLFFQAGLMVFVVKFAYWTNYPENKYRDSDIGFGSGEVIFTDPLNQITHPNIRGTGTAFDYLKWPHPARKGVEDLFNSAFLEAGTVQSETDFATLKAKDLDKTLFDVD